MHTGVCLCDTCLVCFPPVTARIDSSIVGWALFSLRYLEVSLWTRELEDGHIRFMVLCSNSPKLLNVMKPATWEIFQIKRGTTTNGNFKILQNSSYPLNNRFLQSKRNCKLLSHFFSIVCKVLLLGHIKHHSAVCHHTSFCRTAELCCNGCVILCYAGLLSLCCGHFVFVSLPF